ncbi:MAG: threonine/serine exporter family protein [Deferribacteraceae bacterium]|jgi:uncharacterized membrane protein YjjP (DUF1212 family)|nr:threonine/serine exporter family protein [Deferribacteraceae bacterium]
MDNNRPLNDALLGKKLDLLLFTGKLLMQCSADSNRIDRNLRRAAASMGIPADKFNMHINFTTLIINISEGGESVTKLIKIRQHAVNMRVLSAISKMTWRAVLQEYTLDQYEDEIQEISKMKTIYPRPVIVVAAAAACASFATLFSCDLPAAGITFITVAIAIFLRQELQKRHLNHYMVTAIVAFVATTISGLLGHLELSSTPLQAIAASVLFLIPGIPLINSVDDMIDGYTIVGVTRGVNAAILIGSIAFGMVIALWLTGYLNNIGAATAYQSHWAQLIISAALAATGFAVIFNVPYRALPFCALCGVLAIAIRNSILNYTEIGLVFATFLAAVAVGIAAIYLVHKVHAPMEIITIAPVIPLVPGMLMYKTMIGLINTNSYTAEQVQLLLNTFNNGITAFLTMFAISLGIAIPTIFSRRYLSKKDIEFRRKYSK